MEHAMRLLDDIQRLAVAMPDAWGDDRSATHRAITAIISELEDTAGEMTASGYIREKLGYLRWYCQRLARRSYKEPDPREAVTGVHASLFRLRTRMCFGRDDVS